MCQLINSFNHFFKISRDAIYYCILLIAFSVSFINQTLAADAYAVFSLDQNFKPLSKNKVRMLFRGKVKRLQGKQVELSDWSETNAIRNDFYQILLSKDVAQMNAYWASLSFSGKARPPKVIKEDTIKALLEWLAQNKSRIGYAELDMIPSTANVLYIVKKEKQ